MNRSLIIFFTGLLLLGGLGALAWQAEAPVGVGSSAGVISGPKRVVSANITSDEILLALAPERLIAVSYLAADSTISNVVREAALIPTKLKGDIERILILEPDLVVIGSYKIDVARQLEEMGIPIVRIQGFESIDWIRGLIVTLGEAVGESERARRMIDRMNARLTNVKQHVAGRRRPLTLFYSSSGFTGGRGTIVDDVIRVAGGENLAAILGLTGWKKLSLEQVAMADPEVIILSDSKWWSSASSPEILGHPAFTNSRAIRSGRVTTLSAQLMTTSSHHIAETVEAVARLLHPDAFQGESL